MVSFLRGSPHFEQGNTFRTSPSLTNVNSVLPSTSFGNRKAMFLSHPLSNQFRQVSDIKSVVILTTNHLHMVVLKVTHEQPKLRTT